MVKVHDIYSKDQSKFTIKMDNTVASIFKMLMEDKISEDQFEKLLKLRDELIRNKVSPPNPERPIIKQTI